MFMFFMIKNAFTKNNFLFFYCFSNFGFDDAGVYTCNVSNIYGFVTSNGTVSVRSKWIIYDLLI